MAQAFIIIQIGNEELERVCAEAIVPAIQACGLEPRRVDKHNEGGLLKSGIVRFIQDSDLIVADLTNERPNVYLEIGYAMGVDKFRSLVLTVREDHFPESTNYCLGGPRVHFDLAGYDILRWSPEALPTFKVELEKRIQRRLAITRRPTGPEPSIWDEGWIVAERAAALEGLAAVGRTGFMEVRAALHPPKVDQTQTQLDAAARSAVIHTFGWPIAVYATRDDARPRPRADGIFARVKGRIYDSLDYWAIRRNGDFYFLGSLFEDEQRQGHVFFNTRIVRVTEAVLYCVRLYGLLGVDRSQRVSIAVRHGGLRGRVLSAVGNRMLHGEPRTEEDAIDLEVNGTLDEFEAQLVMKVEELVAPLLRVFDFFELDHSIYEDIVNRFVRGEVS